MPPSANPHGTELPKSAAWHHQGSRDGFEVVFISAVANGFQFDGHTSAVENGLPWTVRYSIRVSETWVSREATITNWSTSGHRTIELVSDGGGAWLVNGRAAPELAGCLDIDLESSFCTNTIPVHRLRLGVGEHAEPPAAYVRAEDLRVERLEQQYTRLTDDIRGGRYVYRAPAFEFEADLRYDSSGLIVRYPGIGVRLQ